MAEVRNTTIPLDSITVNLARLVRAGLDPADVDEYARLEKEEKIELPRIDVFKKPDTSPVEYILVDGDARCEARRKNKQTEVAATVHEGSPGDAILFAVGVANATHGRQRTPADKRKAVKLVLEQPEHANKTSREVARLCGGISHHIVEQVREELGDKGGERVDKRGRKVAAKKRKKKNAVLFDFTAVEKEIGHIVKSVDDVIEVYEEEAKRGDYRLVKQAADQLFKAWTKWAKKILKVNE
jgi:transposase-like protein